MQYQILRNLWIKNNAGWWADDKIDDFTFAQGIGFLIKNKIIQIDDLPTTTDGEIAIEKHSYSIMD